MSGVATRLRTPLLIAVPVLVLVVRAGRYGFHRDEWYFVEAGRHPAWSYPDQPPLVPLVAAAWYDLVAGSLPAFRLLPALLAGLVTAIGWATSRELGGDRRTAAVTAAVVGTSSTLLATGHLFGTTIADIVLSSAAVLLLARALRTGVTRDWVVLGLVVAVALTVKTLPVFLLACCAIAVVVTGRAGVLRRSGPWLAVLLAAGLWSTARDAEHAGRRWLPVAAALFLVFVVVTGGKPYYLMGVVPALVAAGVPVLLRWTERRAWRWPAVVVAVVLNAVVGAIVTLPVLPARLALLDVNYDLGEQVGWPELVTAVAEAATDGSVVAVVTSNYGEAGALDAARRGGAALPPVTSGHNGYWWWGPPTVGDGAVLLVGFADDGAARHFDECRQVAELSNRAGVDNDEDGAAVHRCSGPVESWQVVWPGLQRLG